MADVRLGCSVIVLICAIVVHALVRRSRGRLIFPTWLGASPVITRRLRIGLWLSTAGMVMLGLVDCVLAGLRYGYPPPPW